MDNIEKKIEQTLDAFDGIEQAHAPDTLFEKTMQRIAQKKTAKIVPMRTVWAMAASLAFLIALNMGFWFSQPPPNTEGGRIGFVKDKNLKDEDSKASFAVAQLYINKVGL